MSAVKKANDRQVGGNHYKKHGAHQPWDVLRSWLTPEEYRGYMKGTMIVYLARERDKGGDQDLGKVAHYAEKLNEVLLEEKVKNGQALAIARAVIKQIEREDRRGTAKRKKAA